MSGNQTSHITVTYSDGGVEFKKTYALRPDALCIAEIGRQKEKLHGCALNNWLEDTGCQLDREDGPALVVRYTDGLTDESYYRNGYLHREDGPALVRRSADSTVLDEYYYRDGVKRTKDEYDAEANTLLTGLPVAPVGGQDAIDALLREAIEEQTAPRLMRPLSQRDGSEYIPLPRP